MIKILDTKYIEDKGNGTFRIRFRIPGKKSYFSKQISNSTIDEAIAIRDEALKELEDKGKIDSNMKVKDCVNLWMDVVVEINNAGSTIDDKKSKMNNHFLPYFGDKKMCDVTHMEIQKWIKQLMEKDSMRPNADGEVTKLSATTIHNVYNIVRAFFTWASSENKGNIISKTPCSEIELPEMEDYEKEILEEEDIEAFISFIDELSVQNQCAFLIPLFSGLRRGEVLGLRWKNVDFKNKQLTVAKSFSKTKSKGEENKKTKNKKTRTVSMNDLIMTCLSKLKEEQDLQKQVLGKNYKDSGKVFVDECGKQLSPNAIGNRWRRFRDKKLSKHVTYHGLRASYASLLSYYNVPLKDIQDLLGHSDIRITTKHYTLKYNDLNNRVYDITNKFNK